ncbi:MAG: DUF1588 domain-containing protein [Akkermansiaceae bacterium]
MKLFPLLVVLGIGSIAAQEKPVTPQPTHLPKANLQPFLKKYCYECHGADEQEADIRFDQIAWSITNNDTAQRWQDVLDQLNGGDMPPFDADLHPKNEELAAFLETLTGSVNTARQRLTDHGGEIKMRRLNKREYAQTIRELFGFDIDLNDIPDDGEIVTFDTVGAEQFFTSAHFEKYLELGHKITRQSLKLNTTPHRKAGKQRVQPERNVTQKMRQDLAKKDRQKAMIKAGKTWKQAGFKDEGEMKILLRQWDARATLPRNYLKYPKVNQGVYNCDVAKRITIAQHIDHRGEYIVRIHGGIVGQQPDIRKVVRLFDRNQIHGTLKMAGTPNKPETVSTRLRQNISDGRLIVQVRENQPDHTINTMRNYLNQLGVKGRHPQPRASIWVDWLEIEGPFYPKKRPLIEELLYPGQPTGGKSPYLHNEAKAREFILKFATAAFRRRAPELSYIDGLHKRYQQNRTAGLTYKQSMSEIMAIILSSPGFLFIHEAVPAQKKPHSPLSNRELAVRLSYFLWSSPPDAQLYAADLTDPKIYRQQVARLMADPRAKNFRDGFISQWAEFDRFDAITVDRRKHIHFNEGLQQDAKQEVLEYFGTLIQENLPVRNLIHSDFVTINGALAAHYRIPGVNPRDAAFQKIKLPKTAHHIHRGGLITQTLFLTTGSNGERSSPVIRGALVMEKLLNDKPAPPPPNVPELDEASDKPMSNRQLVLLHQKRAACASCHVKMDAIGFGLENFNQIGRWRNTERVGKRRVPIKPGGTLPSGEKFHNVTELKQLLLKNDHHLATQLTQSILSYALGRTIEFSDQDDVQAIVQNLKSKNYPTRDLIREVALSPLFRRR